MDKEKLKKIFTGTEHESIEDAIAADLVSAVPIVGALSDFFRLIDSESRPQKALQALDLITSPIPVVDAFTPTNTLIYLDKRGLLPMKLDKIDKIINLSKTPLSLLRKRS